LLVPLADAIPDRISLKQAALGGAEGLSLADGVLGAGARDAGQMRNRRRPEAGRRDGPLAGVRVLELGSFIAGPFAGRLLGDLGAEIIKIEDPNRPDVLREWGRAHYEGRPLWWPVQSRNKKCVTLDLRTARGQQLLLALIERSDAVMENFRPGTLERWNLGFEQMQSVNRGIVLARISGYGQTGPYASRGGFAVVAEAMGGLRHISGFPGEPPPRMQISLGDSLAALFAVQGILSALYWRDASGGGEGQIVDVSLLEASFALLESTVPEYDRLGLVRGPGGTKLEGIAPSNIFKSRDDKWVVIAANSDSLFTRLCEVMESPELAVDERFSSHAARGRNQDEVDGIVAAWAAQHDAAAIDDLLNDAGVICGPIYTIADIFEDPQVRARDMLVEHEDPEFGTYIGPGVVPKLSATPGSVRWSATWVPGSHNEEIYGGLLGLEEAELSALRADGVI
jgi:formyl-CoA transferase